MRNLKHLVRGSLAFYVIMALANPSVAKADPDPPGGCNSAPNPNCQLCGENGCFVICDPGPSGGLEYCDACKSPPTGPNCGYA